MGAISETLKPCSNSRWMRNGKLGGVEYIRFEEAVDNSRGVGTGIFGLGNGLAHS